jgi:ABC-type nickel/cobalt efflux system permease component RcnA
MDTNAPKDRRSSSRLIWFSSCIAFMMCCGMMSRLQGAGESASVFQWMLLIATGLFFLVATWGLWKSGEALRRKYAWPKPTAKP